jgi:hypothetical protein
MRQLPSFLIVVATSALGSLVPRVTVAQHRHGQATLNIGLDGRQGEAEFRAPGDDLYGFEREPRTSVERAKRDAALQVLRNGAATLIRFEATLGCALTPVAVGVVAKAGDHGEVSARYAIVCQKDPAGYPIAFGFTRAFPGVQSVKVQLLTETTQVGLDVKQDRGVIRPD